MKKEFLNYFLKLTFLTIAIAVIAFGLLFSFFRNFYQPAIWFLILFFYSIHVVGHFVLVYANTRKKLNFGNAYFLAFGVKFFAYLVFLFLYIRSHKENAIIFVASMFALYIIYTIFDVRSTISFSKTLTTISEKSN